MVQVHSGLPNLRSKFEEVANDGAIAQLGERLLCTQEVSGSIPLGSINDNGRYALFIENWISKK